MYERFYRLRERPFALTPDPDYLYPSRVHREALSYLRYGIESQAGFVVITGAIGSGKTTLLQTMLRGLDGQTTVARVMNTLLDPRELLESAMIDLGLDPAGQSKPAMLKAFGEFLVNERAAGRLVLLVIDEAQNLSLPALEEIRMLSNLETEKSKLLQIILVGQPDLRDKLDRPELEQLRQRITVSYHLEPLDAEETAHYINHRLARASIGPPLEFTRPVTDRVHDRSGGVPRLINVISDAALVFGYGEERTEIDAPLVAEVIADLDSTGVLGPRSNPNRHDSVVPVAPLPAVPAVSPPPPAPKAAAAPIERTPPVAPSLAATSPAPQPAETVAPRRDFIPAAAGAMSDEHTTRARELAEREQQLRQREAEMAAREKELSEQRRVLAEQYRLLRSRPPQPAQSADGGIAPAAWPPVSTITAASPRVRPQAANFTRYKAKRRASLWRRVKQTLLGTPEPVLEDSL